MADLTCFNWEKVELRDTPQALSPSVFAPTDGHANEAFITVEGSIRYMLNGDKPTHKDGHFLSDGFLILKGDLQIEKFRAFNVGDAFSTMQISYLRE